MFDTDNIIQLFEKITNSDKALDIIEEFIVPYLDELVSKIEKKEMLAIYKYIKGLYHKHKDFLENTKTYKRGGDLFRSLQRKEDMIYHYSEMLEEEKERRESDYWENDPVPAALMEYLKDIDVWIGSDPEEVEKIELELSKTESTITNLKKEISDKYILLNDLNERFGKMKEKFNNVDIVKSEEEYEKMEKALADLDDHIAELESNIDDLKKYGENNLEDLLDKIDELKEDKLTYGGDDVYKLHEIEEEGYGIRKFEYGAVNQKDFSGRDTWIVGSDETVGKLAKQKVKNRIEGEASLYMNMSNLDTERIISDYTQSESSHEHDIDESPENYLDEDDDKILTDKGREFYDKYNGIYSNMDSDNQYDSDFYDALYEIDNNLDFTEMLALLQDWLDKIVGEETNDLDNIGLNSGEFNIEHVNQNLSSDVMELEDNLDEMVEWDDSKISAKATELHDQEADSIANDPAEYLRGVSAGNDSILMYMDVDSTVDSMLMYDKTYVEYLSKDSQTHGDVDGYMIYPYSG